jgi:hypothetical protein
MGRPADVTRLRTFGCLLYAKSTKRRDAKLTTENIIRSRLLGYGGSMKTFRRRKLDELLTQSSTRLSFPLPLVI